MILFILKEVNMQHGIKMVKYMHTLHPVEKPTICMIPYQVIDSIIQNYLNNPNSNQVTVINASPHTNTANKEILKPNRFIFICKIVIHN